MSPALQSSLDYVSKLSRQPSHIQRLIEDGKMQGRKFLESLSKEGNGKAEGARTGKAANGKARSTVTARRSEPAPAKGSGNGKGQLTAADPQRVQKPAPAPTTTPAAAN